MSTQTGENEMPVKMFFVAHTPENVNLELAPIIFLHGLGGTNRSWNKVKLQISERTKRKIYALDLRNHGQSEWCDGIRMKHYVMDLIHFFRSENIPKAVLVGHSLGGKVAISLAFQKPEIVEKLVIEDTALRISDRALSAYKKFINFVNTVKKGIQFLPTSLSLVEAQKKVASYIEIYYPELVGNASASSVSFILPFHKAKSGKFVWDCNYDALSAIKDDFTNLEIDFSENSVYDGDLFVIGGDKSDFLTESDIDLYKKHFPKCQSHFFKNGYHILHVEFPEQYIEVVSDFIGE